jgi:hypothetical protein
MDGYRVLTEEREHELLVSLVFKAHGQVVQSLLAGLLTQPVADDLALCYPAHARNAKLLAAMLRFFNEGGTQTELEESYNYVQQFISDTGQTQLGLQLVAVESEETHARMYALPDGNYLRIIEDETHEVLSPEDVLRMMEETPEDDEIGQGDLH